MTKYLALILFWFTIKSLPAQDSLGNIGELQKLMKQRQDQFEAYANAAEQRSGIFKNKTKKDLEESREILLQIVNIDNRIMSELNRVVSSRGLAKANYSFDVQQYTETISNLTAATDTLSRQLDILKHDHAGLEKKEYLQRWLMYIFAGTTLLLIAMRFLRKR